MPATRSEPSDRPVPRWLDLVLKADRAGSAWYVGTGFLFAPILAVLSPWPAVTAVLWTLIAVAGLWLGLLGIAMATGLALALRSGTEIPDSYWRSLVGYPPVADQTPAASLSSLRRPVASRYS